MATEKPYTILVSGLPHDKGDLPDSLEWTQFGPFSASSGEKAIEMLWEASPHLKVDTDLRYFPVANFKPKRQRRSFIEKWSLEDAELPDEDPPGQTELAT